MPYISRLRVSRYMLITLFAIGSYSVFMYLLAPETERVINEAMSGPVTEIDTDNEAIAQVMVPGSVAIDSIDQSESTQQETSRQRSYVSGERKISRYVEIEESSPRGEIRENTVPYRQDRRREQYPVAGYSSSATDYRAIASRTPYQRAAERVPPIRRVNNIPTSSLPAGSTSEGASGSRGEQATAATGEAEPRELTPEEINPYLPDGSVAEDTTDGNRQAKIECPTFIAGQMKTRYSYKVLESMGCSPGFNY